MIITKTTIQISIDDLAAAITQFMIGYSKEPFDLYRKSKTDGQRKASESMRQFYSAILKDRAAMEEIIKLGKSN